MAEPRHYVLWLINAVQDWDKPTLLRALCSAPGITAELGDREASATNTHGIDVNDHEAAKVRPPPYAGITEYTPLGALMHEGGHLDGDRLTKRSALHGFDEYFVPIPVKCIGDPSSLVQRAEALRTAQSRGTLTTADAQAALARILSSYPAYFDRATAPYFYERYWTEGFSGAPTAALALDGAGGGEVRMHSRPYVGYYEMLVRWNERPGHERDRHVLLGYSQGGLVGRFVTWLDEHVFQLGLVHGVVTVQTPNFGSPVARHDNHAQLERVLGALLQKIPLGLARFGAPLDFHSLIAWLAAHKTSITIDGLDDALAASILEIRRRIARGESVSASDSRDRIGLLVAARKWLSGLCSKRSGEQFAFSDLSPARNWRASPPGAGWVLSALNDAGHTVPHAAVIGCNPSLEALFGGGITGFLGRALAHLFGVSLDTLTREYQTVFDERERLGTDLTPGYQALADLYVAGAKKPPLEGLAHDCVIPSSHQLLYAPQHKGPAAFIGHFINRDSNHASGTALTDAPPSDLMHVAKAFAALAGRDVN